MRKNSITLQKISLLFVCLLSGMKLEAQEGFLSKEAYLQKVEAYSQQLKQQCLQREISTQARKKAHTGFLPKISLEAEGTLNLNDLKAWNEPIGTYRNHTYQGLVTITQPLYTGGGLRAKQQMAKADEQLALLHEELTLQQIHYQSEVVYWNASAAEALLKAATQYQSIVEQQYQLIQDRFKDGMIGRTDVLMITTRLKEAKLQWVQARQKEALTRQKLNILMGIDPDAPVDSLYNIDQPIDLLPTHSFEEVVNRRPEYRSTQFQLIKSQSQRKSALSPYNPQLSMFFSGGWATATPNLGYDVSFNPMVGIRLTVPLFQWGARFHTNRQQKALVGIQKLQQSKVADCIKEELSNAFTQMKETASQVQTAHETMNLANESLELLSFSYKEGKASMVEVLSAQLTWIQARTHLIHAYLSQKIALAQYRKIIHE